MPAAKHGTWRQALGSLSISVLVLLTFRWVVFEPYVIPSGSMNPTLLELDYIYVNKFAYGLRLPFLSQWLFFRDLPKRCDVVVFRSATEPGQFVIKRVLGLPGESIELLESGRVRIDGQLLRTEVLSDPEAEASGYRILQEHCERGSHRIQVRSEWLEQEEDPVVFSTAVPEASLILFGDNRHNSADSRVWGALPRESLMGEARGIWLSCADSLPGLARVCNPAMLRTERIFRSLALEPPAPAGTAP